jgi:hypothetical protein
MKSINKNIIFWATILFVILLLPSFLSAWAEDEGTLGTNIMWISFAKTFKILRFPTHTLFWPIISKFGSTIYFFTLFINCLFYGFISERIITLLKKLKHDKN